MSRHVAVSRPVVMAAASVSVFLLSPNSALAAFDVVEHNIADLEQAYLAHQTTAASVVQQYLDRINQYNFVSGGINAVGQVNPNALTDAAAIDALIAGGATTAQYPLLGVPVLVKDSYNVQGMTTTNGVSVLNGASTQFATNLIAPTDAFSVGRLKAAGAIIIGKASMSTMAYSFDGIDNAHGVVKNPYQPLRQPGGSSSGTGAGIASNFAMLGMGGETGGSIRIPSNANADVGLKTSAGLIDPSGTWPLTPSRDVVGPIAKTVTDVAYAMNALVAPSSTNLWNGTPYYSSGNPGTVRPTDYTASLSTTALQGKVLAVPKSMANIGTQYEGTVHPLVLTQFNQALTDLRNQGATIVYVDLPASTTYYNTLGRPGASGGATTTGFPYPYPTTTVGGTTPSNTWSSWAAAYYYNELIKSYNDPVIHNLSDFANALDKGRNGAAGSSFSTLNGAFTNITAMVTILNAGNAKGFGDADNNGIPDNPDAIQALQAFTSLRNDQYEGFMHHPNLPDDPTTVGIDESTITSIDSFVAPTYGGIMPYVTSALRPAGTPPDPYSVSGTASLLGRFEGNILGAPSLSVPMGYAPDGTPMGIQFFDELMGESKLIGFAYDYEQATLWRHAPDLIAAIPEPASMMVLGVAGFIVAGRRRRITQADSPE